VYPQAYAAAVTAHEQLKDARTVNLVDLGGYTVDLLQLINMRPNMSVCTSLYGGVNALFQKINEQVRARGAKDIPDATIEGILLNDPKILSDCSQERIELIQTNAKHFTRELLFSISQTGLDLVENRTAFVGGGSILLRDYIERTRMVADPYYIGNVHSNAEGYQLLYDNDSRKSTQSPSSK